MSYNWLIYLSSVFNQWLWQECGYIWIENIGQINLFAYILYRWLFEMLTLHLWLTLFSIHSVALKMISNPFSSLKLQHGQNELKIMHLFADKNLPPSSHPFDGAYWNAREWDSYYHRNYSELNLMFLESELTLQYFCCLIKRKFLTPCKYWWGLSLVTEV